MRRIAWSLSAVMVLAGCAQKQSSLLLERHARGPLAEASAVGHPITWRLDPGAHTQEQRKIEVEITFASIGFLDQFFNNRAVFGPFAGSNPYFLENIVFYVKISNHSDKPIKVDPMGFILVDDRGNQYATINEDYVNALAEARTPIQTATRGVFEEARPGYFGVGVPIGKIFNTKPQGRFALIKRSSLQAGLLYPGVVHDGLVAFWSPDAQATTLRLILTNIQTDLDANGVPQASLEFPFTFTVIPKK